MAKKKFLDSIDVPNPCNESWDEMLGNDEVRFCSHCAKNVQNLSMMTRTSAEELVEKSNGNLWVRYVKDPTGKFVSVPPRSTQIARRATIAAGVLATSLTLSTMAYSQGSPRLLSKEEISPQTQQNQQSQQETGRLEGMVYDPNGGVMPKVKITLLGKKNKKKYETFSKDDGQYEFPNLVADKYQVTAELYGFKKLILKNIKISKKQNVEKNLYLEVARVAKEVVINNSLAKAKKDFIHSEMVGYIILPNEQKDFSQKNEESKPQKTKN